MENNDMKRVYISGPMRGLPDNNRKAFEEAEYGLLDDGFAVVNPTNVMKVLKPMDTTDEEYLSVDLFLLDMCDAIFMLRGWHDSEGARLEHERAQELGIPIFYQEIVHAT